MSNGTRAQEFNLEALRSGDRAEFARLVEAYDEVIYRLAIKMMGDPQDAEDVLQETFLKAYRGMQDFGGRSSLSTWLYRIATNEALMLLRRKKDILSLDEPLETAEGEQEPLQVEDWCCLPEEELLSAEVKAHLDEAIQALPASLRVAFVLRDMQGLSTQEAGEVLNLSETAVKTRLSRARLRLRQDLSSYFSDKLSSGSKTRARNDPGSNETVD